MAEVQHKSRTPGKVQVVSSSLPPPSTKSRSSRRRNRPSGDGDGGSGGGGGGARDAGPEIPEDPDNVAPPEIVLVDKQSICVDILAAGFVQSFVDFFYLTHRPDPIQETYTVGQAPAEIDVSIEDMEVIKTHLVEAEGARRKPDQVDAVYSHLNDLAKHFQERSDQRTGVYFYEKCLEIARIMQDVPGEMKAAFDLGSAYQAMKDYLKAAEYQEQHLSLAKAHAANVAEAAASAAAEEAESDAAKDAQRQVELAYNQLKATYTAYGDRMEAEGHTAAAIEYHGKCLQAAEQTTDEAAEASAHYRLGRALVLSDAPGDAARGKVHLSQSLELCNQLGDIRGQGLAYSALAAMSQKSGGGGGEGSSANAEVFEHLKNFLRVSESTGNIQVRLAESCDGWRAIGGWHAIGGWRAKGWCDVRAHQSAGGRWCACAHMLEAEACRQSDLWSRCVALLVWRCGSSGGSVLVFGARYVMTQGNNHFILAKAQQRRRRHVQRVQHVELCDARRQSGFAFMGAKSERVNEHCLSSFDGCCPSSLTAGSFVSLMILLCTHSLARREHDDGDRLAPRPAPAPAPALLLPTGPGRCLPQLGSHLQPRGSIRPGSAVLRAELPPMPATCEGAGRQDIGGRQGA
jgi:tetratricopeptide (TPR) repeat protein